MLVLRDETLYSCSNSCCFFDGTFGDVNCVDMTFGDGNYVDMNCVDKTFGDGICVDLTV